MSARVRAHPDSAICVLVDVSNAWNADTAVIEYGDTTAYGRKPPLKSSRIDRQPSFVFGLTPSDLYLRVSTYKSSVDCPWQRHHLRRWPLPSNFPTVHVTMPNEGVGGYVLMGAVTDMDQSGPTGSMSVIVDRTGRPMWYRSAHLSLQGVDVLQLSNGHRCLC